MSAAGRPDPWRLVAPIASPAEAEQAIAAGADELYCGAMLDAWARDFGDDDLLTRRQGRAAHLASEREMREVALLARAAGCPVALALNGRYTAAQTAHVRDLAAIWEAAGGTAVILADPVLLRDLARDRSRLALHVSLLAGVFNASAARLFADLGAARVILPRDLTIPEIEALVATGPEIEYEALALNQRCELVDGLCGFRHAVHLPAGVPCEFRYERAEPSGPAVAWSLDPAYEGHGCMLAFESDAGPVRHLERDDLTRPHCAACQLARLAGAGVRFFKIAGRGCPGDSVVRGVRFLHEASRAHAAGGPESPEGSIRAAYARAFGEACGGERCYYADQVENES